jgi:starch phosphorylase
VVAVTLVHRKGYFYQRLDSQGGQTEEPVEWVVEDYLARLEPQVTLTLEGRPVRIAAWQYDVVGVTGYRLPVILLDTDLPENNEGDRTLTHYLYGGDARYRLMQEAVLGVGGVRMLQALGYTDLQRFHMNEGHAALLVLELLNGEAARRKAAPTDLDVVEAVRRKCVFTTHTPVGAGHDKFPMDLVIRILEPTLIEPYKGTKAKDVVCCDNMLNMTFLGFNVSHFVNGVAKRHGQVSRQMFGHYPIDSITNGVHAATWVCPPMAALFDQHIPGWREDNFSLRYAISIDKDELWHAHSMAKHKLIESVNRSTNIGLDADVLTIGYARRATAYKRPDLILSDLERLKNISSKIGKIQLLFAGKAHPQDEAGKDLIRAVWRALGSLHSTIHGVYIPNYDMKLCQLMVAGVDLWLNTPQPPLEASGTSGMKAAVNGVPSFSILDGWWLEGCIEGVTGWAIGPSRPWPGADSAMAPAAVAEDVAGDIRSLYDKLENVIVPMFYRDRGRFADLMRHAIAMNGSFFNTQRMMQQYVTKAYLA